MQGKLKCVLVDDDLAIHDIFKDYLKNNEFAEITDFYEDPIEFLNSGKEPDLVFLDIILPNMDGLSLAFKIKPTPVILFTGNAERFRDIMNMVHSIDAFPKPIVRERLLKSVENAYILLNSNRLILAYELFRTNEGQVKILLSDILFVRTIKNSHRYLEVYLKGGKKYILKGYSLGYIHKISSFLLQPNRAELVSPEAIEKIEHNSLVKLHNFNSGEKPIYSSLCLSFRKDFLGRIDFH